MTSSMGVSVGVGKSVPSVTETSVEEDADALTAPVPFFPFLDEEERREFTTGIRSKLPILGAVGLVGALTLTIISAILLKLIDGHTVWHKFHKATLPQPAAILSAILSLDAFFLHMAFSEGMNVAWWYKATHERATVSDLHNFWAQSSTGKAIVTGAKDLGSTIAEFQAIRLQSREIERSRKRFSYIALATLFVAIIPLNGILLQNAVNIRPIARSTTSSLVVSLAQDLPFDTVESSGPGSTWTEDFASIVPPGDSSYMTYVSSPSVPECASECTGTALGVGFNVTCTPSTQAYDLPTPDGVCNSSITSSNSTVFSIGVTWDESEPARISVRTLAKNNVSCEAQYSVHECALDLATVSYNFQIYNVSSTWQMGLADDNGGEDAFYLLNAPVQKLLSPPSTHPQLYRGLANFFAQKYDSLVTLNYSYSASTGCASGFDSDGIFAETYFDSASGNCSARFPIGLNTDAVDIDEAAFIVHSMQRDMFYLSAAIPVYMPTSDLSALEFAVNSTMWQTATSPSEYWYAQCYVIEWGWYWGSLVTTLAIVTMISPTFWGFWRLARKTTMSPLETARAFGAPIVAGAEEQERTSLVLARVGHITAGQAMGGAAGGLELRPIEKR